MYFLYQEKFQMHYFFLNNYNYKRVNKTCIENDDISQKITLHIPRVAKLRCESHIWGNLNFQSSCNEYDKVSDFNLLHIRNQQIESVEKELRNCKFNYMSLDII